MLALGLVSACLSPAHADDGPFQLENSQWKSFEHSADDASRAALNAPPEVKPEATTVPAPLPAAEAKPDVTAPALAVATPNRPIDLPTMPGLNKGFSVQVNSTEAEKPPLPASIQPVATATTSDSSLIDKNWVAPSAPKAGQSTTDEDGEILPLNVRQTFLPSPAVSPAPKAEHETAQHLAHLAMEKGLPINAKKKPTTPAEMAACAALDAYKKQQLDALQSDRQTLKALQDAISSLGLSKQLSFMAGAGGNTLNASDVRPAGGMDMPVATDVR